MFRFPYRRVWAEPDAPANAPPSGLLSWLLGLLFGKAGTTPTRPILPGNAAPRPVVAIRIRGPMAARRLKSALLDTGSQDTIFPMALAEALGIDLGSERRTIRWRGQQYWVEYQEVELELTHNELTWRWRARVGFTAAPLAYALLGQRGCLEFLDARFCGADQIVELDTNRAFPGSIGPAA